MQKSQNFEIVSTPLAILGNPDVYLSIPEGAIGTTHRPHYSDAQIRNENSAVDFLTQLKEGRKETISKKAKWEEMLREHISRAEWREAYALAHVMRREAAWYSVEYTAPVLGALTLYLLNSRGYQFVAAQTPEDGLAFNFKHLGEAFWLGEEIAENYPILREEVAAQRALTSELLLESAIKNPVAALQIIERMSPYHPSTDGARQARSKLQEMLGVHQISEEAREKLASIIPEKLRTYEEAHDPVGASEFVQLMMVAGALTQEQAGECLIEAAQHINSHRYAKSLTNTLNQYGDPETNPDSSYTSAVESLHEDPYRILGGIPTQIRTIISARLSEAVAANPDLLDHSNDNDPTRLFRIYFESIDESGIEPSREVIEKYLDWIRNNNRLRYDDRVDYILMLCDRGYVDEERRFMEISLLVDNLRVVHKYRIIDTPSPEFGETKRGQLYMYFEDPFASTVVTPAKLLIVVERLAHYAGSKKLDISDLVNIPSVVEKLQAMLACFPNLRRTSDLYDEVENSIKNEGPGLSPQEVAAKRLQETGKKRLRAWQVEAAEHEIKEDALHVTLSALLDAATTPANRHQAIIKWYEMINDARARINQTDGALQFRPYSEIYL